MKLTIKKSAIKSAGNNIIDYTNNFSSDIKKLNDIIDGINSAWNGADSLKLVNTLRDNYIKNLIELSETLEKYGEYLKNIPGAYDLLDEVFANKNINV